MDKTMLSCGCVIDWAKAEADERGCKFKSPTTGQECEFPETHGPDSDTCPLCHPKPSPSQAGFIEIPEELRKSITEPTPEPPKGYPGNMS